MKNFWLLLCVITLSAPCFANSDGDKIPNNQIWYTTTYDGVITPYRDDFGANIISNTYENGKGIITFDGEVTTIGSETFFWTSLDSITIPNSVTEIGDRAFEVCEALTNITISNSVTTIGDGAFSYCMSLTNITIPDSVTEIGAWAFSDCESLTNITIPDGVTEIGERAFYSCGSLTNITISDSVTEIGEWAFSGCSSLKEFKGKFATDDGRCLIVDGRLIAFAPAAELTHYSIPDSVTTIGNGAFYDCSSLTNITIPDSVTEIGERAFSNCWRLTRISAPDSETTIWDEPLDITIPNGVTEIGEHAFHGCYRISGITIPNSVTKIGDYAFGHIKCLEIVHCEAITPPSLGRDAFFMGFDEPFGYNGTIYVPYESVDAYKNADGWKEYADQIKGYDF